MQDNWRYFYARLPSVAACNAYVCSSMLCALRGNGEHKASSDFQQPPHSPQEGRKVLPCKDQHRHKARWMAAGPAATTTTALQLVVLHHSLSDHR